MDKIIILNGPNLNLLGEREKNQYGSFTLKDVEKSCKDYANQNNIELSFFSQMLKANLLTKFKMLEIVKTV